jgi:hypothetical protein
MTRRVDAQAGGVREAGRSIVLRFESKFAESQKFSTYVQAAGPPLG